MLVDAVAMPLLHAHAHGKPGCHMKRGHVIGSWDKDAAIHPRVCNGIFMYVLTTEVDSYSYHKHVHAKAGNATLLVNMLPGTYQHIVNQTEYGTRVRPNEVK